jgi:hypothetical protein
MDLFHGEGLQNALAKFVKVRGKRTLGVDATLECIPFGTVGEVREHQSTVSTSWSWTQERTRPVVPPHLAVSSVSLP